MSKKIRVEKLADAIRSAAFPQLTEGTSQWADKLDDVYVSELGSPDQYQEAVNELKAAYEKLDPSDQSRIISIGTLLKLT